MRKTQSINIIKHYPKDPAVKDALFANMYIKMYKMFLDKCNCTYEQRLAFIIHIETLIDQQDQAMDNRILSA